ncbi:META domain-containing protein [Agitococcus lubricus]|uniref:Heat shock protein HslJ n=1 Tax=Agitococcus lubricus TaxID=1077255 RepID=A0A2T5J2I2_9GAMM|nr:META domain-containing protein [Agitococcus lubricus]PTQ90622.1 heat shock protein HslJ [Agitococcus lubricus]
MMMKKRIVALSTLILLLGCQATPPVKARVFGVQTPTMTGNVYADAPPTLEKTVWRLRNVAKHALVPADKDITIRLENGKASGYAGCNLFNGSYQFDNERFVFQRLAASTQFCMLTSPQEKILFKSLEKVRFWRIDPQTLYLQLLDQHKLILVEYEASTKRPPLPTTP